VNNGTTYKIVNRNPPDFGDERSKRRWDVVRTKGDGATDVMECFEKRDDARAWLKNLKAQQFVEKGDDHATVPA